MESVVSLKIIHFKKCCKSALQAFAQSFFLMHSFQQILGALIWVGMSALLIVKFFPSGLFRKKIKFLIVTINF
jgi:hypothetical protein